MIYNGCQHGLRCWEAWMQGRGQGLWLQGLLAPSLPMRILGAGESEGVKPVLLCSQGNYFKSKLCYMQRTKDWCWCL